jgi:hypothetical protein
MRQEVDMHAALLLHHGVHEKSLNEATSRPHIELMASNPSERERLKVLAEQLAAFGTIPYSYGELGANDPARLGAVLRIGLCERDS